MTKRIVEHLAEQKTLKHKIICFDLYIPSNKRDLFKEYNDHQDKVRLLESWLKREKGPSFLAKSDKISQVAIFHKPLANAYIVLLRFSQKIERRARYVNWLINYPDFDAEVYIKSLTRCSQGKTWKAYKEKILTDRQYEQPILLYETPPPLPRRVMASKPEPILIIDEEEQPQVKKKLKVEYEDCRDALDQILEIARDRKLGHGLRNYIHWQILGLHFDPIAAPQAAQESTIKNLDDMRKEAWVLTSIL